MSSASEEILYKSWDRRGTTTATSPVAPSSGRRRHTFLICIEKVISMDQISIKTPNPKCRLFLKKLTSKGTWRQVLSVCICSPHNPIPSPTPVKHCMNRYLCTYSHRAGGGGYVTVEKVGGALVHKRGRQYQHEWLYLRSINSIKHQ